MPPPTLTTRPRRRLLVLLALVLLGGSLAMAGLFGSERRFADGSTARADEHYLRESILDSTQKIVEGYAPIMPSYRGQITEEQLIELIAYIKSLQDPQDVRDAPRPAVQQVNPNAPTGNPEWTR